MTRSGANKRNKYDTLKCPNPECGNICAPLHLVETCLIDHLNGWLSGYCLDWSGQTHKGSPAQVNNQIRAHSPANAHSQTHTDIPAHADTPVNDTTIHKMAARRISSHLEQLKEQWQRTYELLERGIYSQTVFTERQQALSIQIEETSAQLAHLEASALTPGFRSKDTYIPAITCLSDVYHALPNADAKNAVLKLLLVKVTYRKTERNGKHMGEQANFHLKIYPAVPLHPDNRSIKFHCETDC